MRFLFALCVATACVMMSSPTGEFTSKACGQLVPQPGGGMLGGIEPAGQYPSQAYYVGLAAYREGDLELALRSFDLALGQARKDINGRWIDSIPSLAMAAECHYQMGDCVGAAARIDSVMDIVIRYRGWLSRIDWTTVPQTGVQRAKPSWLWADAAAIEVVPLADRPIFIGGRPLTAGQVARGGVIEEPSARPMDLVEVMRTTAVALFRRRILLGPLSYEDPQIDQVLDAIKYPASVTAALPRDLIGSLRGCGYYAIGNDEKTRINTEAASLGMSTHALAPPILLAGLRTFASEDDVAGKAIGAMRLVHIAAALEQLEWIGPAMEMAVAYADPATAANVHRLGESILPALSRRSRLASAHVAAAAAEAAIVSGSLPQASALVASAAAVMQRRDVQSARVQAYVTYVAMRLRASLESQGRPGGTGPTVSEGLDRLRSYALENRTRRSLLVGTPRVFQLNLIRNRLRTGQVSRLDRLIEPYLDDPPNWLWRTDPVDAISGVMAERSTLTTAWLRHALATSDREQLLMAMDAHHREKFHSMRPLGGRLANVRKIAWSEDDHLPKAALDAADKHPPLRTLRTQALVAASQPSQAAVLEAATARIALSRVHLPDSVLPPLDPAAPTKGFPKDKSVLCFVDLGGEIVAAGIFDDKIRVWTVRGPPMQKAIGALLQMIGVGRGRGLRLPKDQAQRDQRAELAAGIVSELFPDQTFLRSSGAGELVVVPDGPLWYLPIDLLPIGPEGEGDDEDRIGELFDVSYQPTPGCVLVPAGRRPSNQKILLAADEFFAPRDSDANQARVQSVLDAAADAVLHGRDLSGPSGLMGTEASYLCVASARVLPGGSAGRLTVSPADPGGPAGTLASWATFPRAPPASVAWFGLRTPVAGGQMGGGLELFDCLTTLRTAGVSDAVLSRWAVGGESTATLIAEFLPEWPLVGTLDAWRRARQMLSQTDLLPDTEPLLSQAESTREDISGAMPLFWSGYLVSVSRH